MPVVAVDRWSSHVPSATQAGRNIWNGTKSDTDEEPYVFRSVRINVAGTIRLVPVSGAAYVDLTVVAGEVITGFFKQIKSTGTSASGFMCSE